MKANQASWERILRIVGGMVALAWGYFVPHESVLLTAGIMAVGVILAATGIVAYCPAWHLLGISTKNKGD